MLYVYLDTSVNFHMGVRDSIVLPTSRATKIMLTVEMENFWKRVIQKVGGLSYKIHNNVEKIRKVLQRLLLE